MSKIKNEFNLYDIFQNIAIGAIACHSFVQGYYLVAKHKNKSPYPRLEYLFFVLPIVFNKGTMQTFKSSNELVNAILKNKNIIIGLQDRANKMSAQTFDSLNLAFNKQLLSINEKNEILISEEMLRQKISIPSTMNRENTIKNIQDTAKKLGNIFAKNDERNIQLELNIRF